MFKTFIKNLKLIFKTANLEFNKNLIYVADNRIIFNASVPECSNIQELMKNLLRINGIYSDLPYKRLYMEYREHIHIYDSNPLLLYCKIPILISADYEGLRCEFKEVISNEILSYASVDNVFELPHDIRDILSHAYSKSYAYFEKPNEENENEMLGHQEFMRLAKFNYYKDWAYFFEAVIKKNPKLYKHRIWVYLTSMLDILIDLGGSNKQTVTNVINRYLDTISEEYKGEI